MSGTTGELEVAVVPPVGHRLIEDGGGDGGGSRSSGSGSCDLGLNGTGGRESQHRRRRRRRRIRTPAALAGEGEDIDDDEKDDDEEEDDYPNDEVDDDYNADNNNDGVKEDGVKEDGDGSEEGKSSSKDVDREEGHEEDVNGKAHRCRRQRRASRRLAERNRKNATDGPADDAEGKRPRKAPPSGSANDHDHYDGGGAGGGANVPPLFDPPPAGQEAAAAAAAAVVVPTSLFVSVHQLQVTRKRRYYERKFSSNNHAGRINNATFVSPPPSSPLASLYHVLWSNILCFLDEAALHSVERAFPKKTRKVSLFQWKALRQRDMARIQHQRWRPPDVRFLRQQQQQQLVAQAQAQAQAQHVHDHVFVDGVEGTAAAAAAAANPARSLPASTAATYSSASASNSTAAAAPAGARNSGGGGNQKTATSAPLPHPHPHHPRRASGRFGAGGREGNEEYMQSKSVMYGKDFARHIDVLERLVPDWAVYDERDLREEEAAELAQEAYLLSRGGLAGIAAAQGTTAAATAAGPPTGTTTATTTTTAAISADLVRRYLQANMLRRGSRRHLAASAHSRLKTRVPMGIGVAELGTTNYLLFLRLSLLPPKTRRQSLPLEQAEQERHVSESQQQQEPTGQESDGTWTASDDGEEGATDAAEEAAAAAAVSSGAAAVGATNVVPDTTTSSAARNRKRKASCLDFFPFAIPFSAKNCHSFDHDDGDDAAVAHKTAAIVTTTASATTATATTTTVTTKKFSPSSVSSGKAENDATNSTRNNKKKHNTGTNNNSNNNKSNNNNNNSNNKGDVRTTRHWHAFRQIYQIMVHPSRKMALSLSSTFGQFQGLAGDWPEIKEFLEWHELEWTIICTLLQNHRLGQEAESLYKYEEACQAKLIPLLERLELAITIPTAGHLVEHHRRIQLAREQQELARAAAAAGAANAADYPDAGTAAVVVENPVGLLQHPPPQPLSDIGNDEIRSFIQRSVQPPSNVPTAQQLYEQQLRLHESFVAVGRCSSLKWSRSYKTEVRTAVPESRNVLTIPGHLELRAALFQARGNNNIRPQNNGQEQQQLPQQAPPHDQPPQDQPPQQQPQQQGPRSVRFDERQLRFLPDVVFEEAPSIPDDAIAVSGDLLAFDARRPLVPPAAPALRNRRLPVVAEARNRNINGDAAIDPAAGRGGEPDVQNNGIPHQQGRHADDQRLNNQMAAAAAARVGNNDRNIGPRDEGDEDAFDINDDDSVASIVAVAVVPPPQDTPTMPWEVIIPITNSLEAHFLVYRQQPQPL